MNTTIHLFIFEGHTFYYRTCDMSEKLRSLGKFEESEQYGAMFLVMHMDGKVFVDDRAPIWYRHLATMHEYICMDGQYADILSNLAEGDERCASIDLGLADMVRDTDDPELAIDYLNARAHMLELLISGKLNESPQIKISQQRIAERLNG